MRKLEARHWAFLGLFIVVTLTMLINWKPPLTPSPYTQRVFDYIDSLPSGSVLMISFDHEASALPEIQPLALAILRHAFNKQHKLIGVSLLPEGTLIGYRLMQETGEELGQKYGLDYAYLGFRPQYIAAILAMGESIKDAFPQDYLGRSVDSLPVLSTITNYDDVAAVISIADGSLTNHWIEYGRGNFGVKVIGVVTAAMVTTFDPYLASGQLAAMMGGLRGAAEYEQLLGVRGAGARGMLAQSSSHLYIIFLILLGNALYFMEQKRKGER